MTYNQNGLVQEDPNCQKNYKWSNFLQLTNSLANFPSMKLNSFNYKWRKTFSCTHFSKDGLIEMALLRSQWPYYDGLIETPTPYPLAPPLFFFYQLFTKFKRETPFCL